MAAFGLLLVQCRGHRFPLDTRSTPGLGRSRSGATRPVLCNKISHQNKKTAHHDQEWHPLAATRESPSPAMKTQYSQNKVKNKVPTKPGGGHRRVSDNSLFKSSTYNTVFVLVCSGCCNKQYHRLGALNNHPWVLTVWKLEVWDQGAGRLAVWQEPLPGSWWCPYLEKGWGALWDLLWGPHPHNPITPRGPLLTPSYWGLGFNLWMWGDTFHSIVNI